MEIAIIIFYIIITLRSQSQGAGLSFTSFVQTQVKIYIFIKGCF